MARGRHSRDAALAALIAHIASPWHALVWVVLVPGLATLDRIRSWRGALASGAVAAFAFRVVVFWWFPAAITDYAAAPLWLTALLGAVLTPVFQPEFVVFAVLWWGARQTDPPPCAPGFPERRAPPRRRHPKAPASFVRAIAL